MTNRRIRVAAALTVAVLFMSWPSFAIPPISGSASETTQVPWRLLGPDNEPMVGYRVRLTHTTAAMAAESRKTDNKGRVLLPLLVQGTYKVTLLTGDRRLCHVELPEIVVTDGSSPEFTTLLDRRPVCASTPPAKVVPQQSTEKVPQS